MTQTFRPDKSLRSVGLLLSVFFLGFFLTCLNLSFLLAFRELELDESLGWTALIAWAVICLSLLVYQARKIDSQQNKIKELGASLAPEFWLEKAEKGQEQEVNLN